MSLGSIQLLVSSLLDGVVPVMSGKMAQSSVVCQSVRLDLNWTETLCFVAVFTFLMLWMDARVWVLDNLSVMKLDWDPLSNEALHGTH